jgi:hypothetical protein
LPTPRLHLAPTAPHLPAIQRKVAKAKQA